MNESPRILLIASSKMKRTPAFERAVALAKACGAGLYILALDNTKHLETIELFDDVALSELRNSYLQTHRLWLEGQAEKERTKGLDCSVQVFSSEHFFEEFSERVAACHPVMVIKDVHHEPVLKRLFSTPLDWHLLRDCVCPIQFVTDARNPLPLKILAAVNLYRTDDADLRLNDSLLMAAVNLAQRCGAKVHVLYSYDWSAIYASHLTMMGAMPIETGFPEALADAHEEALNALCERHGVSPQRRHFVSGTPEPTINAFARQNLFDLMVMGTLPRRYVGKLFGNTTESLLTHSPCSVMVVKPDNSMSNYSSF